MNYGSTTGDTLREVERKLLTRWPENQVQPTLTRVRALMDLLGEPQRMFPVIHLTGTNGKTSTARMIDALLRARGLRVGRYTSPHLETMAERICVDGEPLSPAGFVAAYEDVVPYVEMVDAGNDIPMSYFEVLTGMAYAAFADTPVDVAVVEVGMGGSWDATNVADAVVSVITPIGVDHVHYLGSGIGDIAAEKAGVIKPQGTVVLAQQPLEAAELLLRRAVEVEASVAREGMEFGVLRRDVAVGGQQLTMRGLRADYDEVFLPLYGEHQAGNAACALAAVEAFTAGDQEPDHDVVRQAFASVSSPGRLEPLRSGPTVLVDAAHNPAGMSATAQALTEAFSFARLVGVVAVMMDKDVRGVLEPLEPILAEVVVTKNSAARSMPIGKLADLAGEIFGPERVHAVPSLDEAIDRGVALAEEDSVLSGAGVVVTGSVVTAGDARRLLKAK